MTDLEKKLGFLKFLSSHDKQNTHFAHTPGCKEFLNDQFCLKSKTCGYFSVFGFILRACSHLSQLWNQLQKMLMAHRRLMCECGTWIPACWFHSFLAYVRESRSRKGTWTSRAVLKWDLCACAWVKMRVEEIPPACHSQHHGALQPLKLQCHCKGFASLCHAQPTRVSLGEVATAALRLHWGLQSDRLIGHAVQRQLDSWFKLLNTFSRYALDSHPGLFKIWKSHFQDGYWQPICRVCHWVSFHTYCFNISMWSINAVFTFQIT